MSIKTLELGEYKSPADDIEAMFGNFYIPPNVKRDARTNKAQANLGKTVPIVKVDSPRQIVYGIVLDPYIVDSQGDWVPVLEVEKAAHGYMKSQMVGDQHEKKADAELVESWLVPYPTPEDYQKAIDGKPHKIYKFEFGAGEVHSGAWVAGIHVVDKQLWREVVSGAKTGLSIGAVGERIRNATVSMPEFETVEPETVPAFTATH